MNVALWIVAGLMSAACLSGGAMKVLQPREKLAEGQWKWAEDFGDSTVKTIGVLEILAAVGLVLPAVVDVAPVLVPVTAVCMGVLMVCAMVTHGRRKETQAVVVNVVLLAVFAFLAWGRFGPHAF